MTVTDTTPEATAPATDSADPEIKVPWNPMGAALGGLVVLVMIGGSLPSLLSSGDTAVIVMSLLFIFFASAIAGAIVYTSTLEG